MCGTSVHLRLAHPVILAAVIGIVVMVPVNNNEVMGFAEVSESIVRSLNDDPNSIDVQITAFGETRNLRLVPNVSAVFAPAFSGYIADIDGTGHVVIQKIVTPRSAHDDIHSKLYTDSTGSASLYVERRDGRIALEGILDHETRIECRNSRQERSVQQIEVHVVYKRVKTKEGTCLTLMPNISVAIGQFQESTPTDEHNVEPRALPSVIQPEVLLVIDYETSKYHKFNLDAVKKYAGIFFNSVNRRYASMSSLKIRNVITGIVLTNSESAQNFVVYGAKPIVDAGSTLRKFGTWVTTQKSITNDPDVIVWMTALDLGILVQGKWSGQNVGVAYVGGACSKSRGMNFNVALGEDAPGSYNGIHTHTHEICHLYGSAHDGEAVDTSRGNPGASSCPRSDGFIMSYEFGGKNKFLFSQCSINQMKFKMESTGASCLLNAPKASVVTSDATYPGTLRSLDNQCADRHGKTYKFVESRLYDVCVRLWCTASTTGPTISMTTQGPALEGSRCGTGKVCISGECKNQ